MGVSKYGQAFVNYFVHNICMKNCKVFVNFVQLKFALFSDAAVQHILKPLVTMVN